MRNNQAQIQGNAEIAYSAIKNPIIAENYMRTYKNAPDIIRADIKRTRLLISGSIRELLRNSKINANPIESGRLISIAALEIEITNPINIKNLKDDIAKYGKNLMEIYRDYGQVNDWMYRHLKPGTYNMIATVPKGYDLNRDSEALYLHDIAFYIASRRIVLIAAGKREDELQDIIEMDIKIQAKTLDDLEKMCSISISKGISTLKRMESEVRYNGRPV